VRRSSRTEEEVINQIYSRDPLVPRKRLRARQCQSQKAARALFKPTTEKCKASLHLRKCMASLLACTRPAYHVKAQSLVAILNEPCGEHKTQPSLALFLRLTKLLRLVQRWSLSACLRFAQVIGLVAIMRSTMREGQ